MRALALVLLGLLACRPSTDVTHAGSASARPARARPLPWPGLRARLRGEGSEQLSQGLCCALGEALASGLRRGALDGGEAREWLRTARVLRSGGSEDLAQALLRGVVALSRDPDLAAVAMLDRFEHGDLVATSQRTRVEWLVHCAGLLDQEARVLRVLDPRGDVHVGPRAGVEGPVDRVRPSEGSGPNARETQKQVAQHAPRLRRRAPHGSGNTARHAVEERVRAPAGLDVITCVTPDTVLPVPHDRTVRPWLEDARHARLRIERALRNACTCTSTNVPLR